MITYDQAMERLAAGSVIANIGQIDKPTKRALERLVQSGDLLKWQGRWFPVAGAPYGLGPLKTCYGSPEAKRFAHWKVWT